MLAAPQQLLFYWIAAPAETKVPLIAQLRVRFLRGPYSGWLLFLRALCG